MKRRAILGDIHPSGQFLFTIGLSLFVTLILIMIGSLVAIPLFGVSLGQFLDGTDLGDPSQLGLLKYMQIISHLGMFIIPSVLLAWFFGPHISRYLFMERLPDARVLFLSAILIFVALPFINFVLEMNMQMHLPERFERLERWMRNAEESAEQVTRAFLSVETISGLMFNLLMVAVIPAIGEELMFRGVLFRIFKRWTASKHLSVWITAILFSAIHLQFFGFIPRMILGVLFGYLVVYSGSIWPAIIAHFVNNAAAVVVFYLFQSKITESTFENIGKGTGGMIYGLVSLVLTIALIMLIRKFSHKTHPREISEPDNSL